MAHPRIADGGDNLQIWRVAANILNKQTRTADMGGPPDWGLGEGEQLNVKKQLVTKCHTRPRNWAGSCEYGNEPSDSGKGREFLD